MVLTSFLYAPPAFCDGYSQGYPHGIEFALGRELGAKAPDHDWQLLLVKQSPTVTSHAQEKTPPCPSELTTDWCDGFQAVGEYLI